MYCFFPEIFEDKCRKMRGFANSLRKTDAEKVQDGLFPETAGFYFKVSSIKSTKDGFRADIIPDKTSIYNFRVFDNLFFRASLPIQPLEDSESIKTVRP